jgi:hypothetical protein
MPLLRCDCRILTVLALVGAWPAASFAQDGQPFRRWYTYDYVVRSSELIDLTSRTETKVIAPSMVQSLGQHRLSMPNQVCTREIANELRDLAVAAARDFNSRLRIVDVGFNGPYNDDAPADAPD